MDAKARTTSDPLHLFRKYQRTGDEEIRNRLIERYLYVVEGMAKRVHGKMPSDVQLGDVISAGVFGLINAIDLFDPNRGLAFVTYAGRRIRGAILDWAREQDSVPRLTRERSKKMEAAVAELRAQTGETPSPHEVAKKLRMDKDEFETFERGAKVRQIVSLSRIVESNGKDVKQLDLLTDPKSIDPASDPNHTALRDLLLKYWSLSQALLIRLYYVDELPMSQIGEALGHSESRISQIHNYGRVEFDELISLAFGTWSFQVFDGETWQTSLEVSGGSGGPEFSVVVAMPIPLDSSPPWRILTDDGSVTWTKPPLRLPQSGTVIGA